MRCTGRRWHCSIPRRRQRYPSAGADECPLLAQSGHWADPGRLTAFDPKRTFRLEVNYAAGEGYREPNADPRQLGV